MPFNPLNRNLCHKYASSTQCNFFPAILPTSTSKNCSNMNYRTEMSINVSNIVQRSQQLDSRSLDVLLALARWGECRDTVRGVSIDQLSSIEEETFQGPLLPHNADNVRGWTKHVQNDIQQLSSLRELLSHINKTLKNEQAKLTAKLIDVSTKFGFSMLTNEMVGRIFDFVGCDWKDNRKTMSLVCRRFRDIIISTPKYWRSISNSFSVENVALHMTRSRGLSLDVTLDVGFTGKRDPVRFLRTILVEHRRWQSFRLNAFHGIANWYDMGQIHALLQGLSLPKLESVIIEHLGHRPYANAPVDNDEFHFYITWDAPSVKSWYSTNLFPRTNRTFRLEEVTIDISWRDRFDTFKWSTTQLGEFLSEQPCIETLELGLTFADEYGLIAAQGTHVIPTLRTLRFKDMSAPTAPTRPIKDILRTLEIPSLETLELRINDDDITTRDLEEMFSGGRFANLKNLLFSITDNNVSLEVPFQPLESILPNTPNLQYLRLESPHLKTGLKLGLLGNNKPPLHTVDIDSCRGVTGFSVSEFVRDLHGSADCSEFGQLRIGRGLDVDVDWIRNSVKGYLPGLKVYTT